jgi:hypothetical protein
MPITSFDKKNLGTIREDITNALKAVEQKHGMKLALGSIRFDANTFSGKLTGAVGTAAETTEGGANSELKWRQDFLSRHIFYGLEKDDLGKEISVRGGKYIIVGSRSKAKAQIVLKKVGSDKYIAATKQEVKQALGRPLTMVDNLDLND